MLILTSKYLLLLLVLVSIIFTVDPSFSETEKKPDLIKSDLTKLGAEIMVSKLQLKRIWTKLLIIESEGRVKSHFQTEFQDLIEGVNSNLSEIITLLGYESESIITIPHIMEKYKSFFAKLRIENINHTKKLINIDLNWLNYVYSESEYKTTLSAIGDPRKYINSALDLFDKSILILESIKENNRKQ